MSKIILTKKINLKNLYYIVVFVVAFFSRILLLDSVPAGLHVDEAGMAYDAFCLANYGVDRYLMSFPVYFINFGGGQNALYTYLSAILIKIIGLNIWSIRLPGVISSFLTLVFGEKIVLKICGKESASSYVFPMIYIGCPVFVMSARFGLESYLMLGSTTAFLYALIIAIDTEKYKYFVISGFVAGLSLYTYAVSYLVMPIFLFLVFIYLFLFRRVKIKNLVCFIFPLFVLALPLVVTQYINFFGKETIEFCGITMPALPIYRRGEIVFPSIGGLLSAIKSSFLFDELNYNSIPAFGTMLYITIPFILFGFILSFKKFIYSLKTKTIQPESLIVFWFLIELLVGSMLGGNGPNVNKMNGIFFSMAFFAAYGIDEIVKKFKQKFRPLLYIVLACSFAIYSIAFYIKYFGSYTDNLYLFQKPLDEVIYYIETNDAFDGKYVVFVYDNQPDIQPYIYFCLALELSPYDLQYGNTMFFSRYVFYTPIELSTDYVYLVFDGNEEFVDMIKQSGCNQIIDFDGASIVYRDN